MGFEVKPRAYIMMDMSILMLLRLVSSFFRNNDFTGLPSCFQCTQWYNGSSSSVAPDHKDTIFWFHDESSYNANDDQTTLWKDDTMQVIKPKSRSWPYGVGLYVMVISASPKVCMTPFPNLILRSLTPHVCYLNTGWVLEQWKVRRANGGCGESCSIHHVLSNMCGCLITRVSIQHMHQML